MTLLSKLSALTRPDYGRFNGLSPCGSNPAVSPVPASIPNAWWEQDPEFHEYLDEMERQDYDRQA